MPGALLEEPGFGNSKPEPGGVIMPLLPLRANFGLVFGGTTSGV